MDDMLIQSAGLCIGYFEVFGLLFCSLATDLSLAFLIIFVAD